MEEINGNSPRMDWLNILRYHREVIEKGSDDFFSIPVEGVNRYARLLNFSPETFEGPWSITADAMIMEFLEEQFASGEKPQLILGCLCWKSSKKGKRFLNPLLYMDVSIAQVIEDLIILKPDSLHWNFSPFLDSALRSKQIRLQTNLHEKLPELLKKAEEDYNPATKNLTTAFKEGILKEVPVLKEILDKDVLVWMIFTPPKSYEFTRHVLNDYKEIERQIEDNPEAIGGLRLLEGLENAEIRDLGKVLPIVPLNPEQKRAVSHILSENPITVISGPPGCGKSQVVVSALINCWAEGKTALFASYVNNAVDVIHERITRIEGDAKRSVLPVTIKAGKKEGNTICSGIAKIKDAVIQYEPIKPERMHDLQSIKHELENEKKYYKQFIDTGIPQQIDESLHSASDAYATAMECQEALDRVYNEYKGKIKEVGYQIEPEDFGCQISSIEEWLNKRFDCLSKIKENTKKQEELQGEINALAEDIGYILNSFGLLYNSRQWHLLHAESYSPEKLLDWNEKYKSTLLNKDMSKAIRSEGVKSEHRLWSGIEEVEKWLDDTHTLTDRLESIINYESGNIEEIKRQQAEYNRLADIIRGHGFSEGYDINKEILIKWQQLYREYVTIPKGFLLNPFSKRRRVEKDLRNLEAQTVPLLPVPVKNAVGISSVQVEKKLSDSERLLLSPYVDDYLCWLGAKDDPFQIEFEESRIRSIFSGIAEGYASLKFYHPPDSILDVDGWYHSIRQLKEKIEIAEDAMEAFRAGVLLQELRDNLTEFGSIAASSPVKKAWSSNAGRPLTDSIKKLLAKPDSDSLDNARDIALANDLEVFVSEWKLLIEHVQEYEDKIKEIREVPSEDELIKVWWAEDPTSNVNYPDHRTIPEDVSQYEEYLKKCRDIHQSWNEHAKTSIPEEEIKIQDNLAWARSEIENACRKIPDEAARVGIETQILHSIKQHDKKWPFDDIRSLFGPFRSSEINIRIARIDQKLQVYSFEIASNQRVETLRSMNSASEGRETALNSESPRTAQATGRSPASLSIRRRLTELLDFYERAQRNSYILPREKSDLFSGCLPALPIWVTTSLSTQSIPRKPGIYDLVVIDEACQCDISSVLPMIYRARRLAVIGDPHQLDAINKISSPELDQKIAKDHGIERVPDTLRHINNNLYKLAERSLPDTGRVVDLLEHYRSHPQIVGFINMHVYNKKLLIKKEINCTEQDLVEEGIFGVNVRGACERFLNSWQNKREADEVVRVARMLLEDKGYNGSQIGVVTPFSPQEKLIETKIHAELGNTGITVGTANTFQGNERDVMIFSPVLSQGVWDVSVNFVQNPVNRVNVALSRARNALYVVADFEFCKKTQGIISNLIQYIETIQALRVGATERGYEQLYLYTLMLVEGWKPDVNRKVGGTTVDLILQEPGANIAIFITSGSTSESDKARRIEAVKSQGFEPMDIPARKISETPKEVIVSIHTSIDMDRSKNQYWQR